MMTPATTRGHRLMSTRLDQIVAATRRRVSAVKSTATLCELEKSAESHVPRGFRKALASQSGVAVIAELKKASPSKGLIRADFDVEALAKQLEAGGARNFSKAPWKILSVLHR